MTDGPPPGGRPEAVRVAAARLYDALEAVEVTLADFYGWLSSSLAEDHEVSQLFAKMQVEELRHAHWVKGQQWDATLGNVDVPEFAERDATKLTQAVQRFRAEHPQPTAERALLFALELEASAAEDHRRLSQQTEEASLTSLLQQLSSGDDEHVADLMRLAKLRGV